MIKTVRYTACIPQKLPVQQVCTSCANKFEDLAVCDFPFSESEIKIITVCVTCQLLITEHEKRKHNIPSQSIKMTAQWAKREIQAFFYLVHLKSSCFQMPLLLPVANS